MGLCIPVGILADMAKNDAEIWEQVRHHFPALNAVLRSHGLPEHSEPATLPELDDRSSLSGFPYSFLHYLRRFCARRILEPDRIPTPVAEGERHAEDPAIAVVFSARHHLLCHSDCDGYYLPIDFPEVLTGEGIARGGGSGQASASTRN